MNSPLRLATTCVAVLVCLSACAGSTDAPTGDAIGPDATTTQPLAINPSSQNDTDTDALGSVDKFCAAAEQFDSVDLDEDVTPAEMTQLEGLVKELTATAPADLREDVSVFFGEILRLAKQGKAVGDSQDPPQEFQNAMENVFAYGVEHCYHE